MPRPLPRKRYPPPPMPRRSMKPRPRPRAISTRILHSTIYKGQSTASLPFPHQMFAVQVMHCIAGVTVVVKFLH
ncbi:hypothetical protein M514_09683 [Trichuris suis]|uniref:Uncharacterized protein n=1 Tax=Trichuris suis TaxID=68888 RepID=A0A085N2D6_9BILA|nr:hypothetical protein M513_09683 [Trichuris suis]KFD63632.1 hypothetical protein M514_09683 [Trichuris suis]